MSEVIPRTPTLAQVIRAAINNRMQDVYTCLPAKITEYNSKKQTVDVQPLINSLELSENGVDIEEQMPILPDVPVSWQRNGEYFVTFPLKPGDIVELRFSMRSIDKYMQTSGKDPVNPDDFRTHDLSDAIAVPGFYPTTKAVKDIDTGRMAMGKDSGGMQIHISGSAVEIDQGAGVTVKFDGALANAKMVLGDGAVSAAIYEQMQLWWDAQITPLLTAFGAHTHLYIPPPITVPTVPTGPPVPLLVPLPFPTTAQSTKVKMPLG